MSFFQRPGLAFEQPLRLPCWHSSQCLGTEHVCRRLSSCVFETKGKDFSINGGCVLRKALEQESYYGAVPPCLLPALEMQREQKEPMPA